MPNLLDSVFNRPCPHQFSWPNRRSEGGTTNFVRGVVSNTYMTDNGQRRENYHICSPATSNRCDPLCGLHAPGA